MTDAAAAWDRWIDRPSLSVVIPAFNEESYVERCVIALEAVLDRVSRDFEIIIVDAGARTRRPRFSKHSRPRTRASSWCIMNTIAVSAAR